MGKWSNLPLELVDIIEDYAALYMDKVRLRAVSLEWSSRLPKLPDHRAKQTHFLLHPLEDEEATHGLFNSLDNTVYKIYVPELNGKVFKASFYGWIVATEELDTALNEIYLINPITRAQVKLPPRTEFSDGSFIYRQRVYGNLVVRNIARTITSDNEIGPFSGMFMLNKYHTKIVLSSDPSNDECVVVATFGLGDIAWCKCDGKKWTRVLTAESTHFVDILYSKRYLYGLTYDGRILMFENIGTELEIKYKEITRVPIPIKRSAYLAECSDGSLIVAARYFLYQTNQGQTLICTKEFKVYKLLPNPDSSWVEVKSIGDDVLFVDFGSVRSLPSINLAGFKKNHIYFCDFAKLATDEDNKNVKPNVGVFNLEDGTVMPLQGLGDCIWPRPIWTNVVNGDHIRPPPLFSTAKSPEKMENQEQSNAGDNREYVVMGGGNRKPWGCRQKSAHVEKEEYRKKRLKLQNGRALRKENKTLGLRLYIWG
jgi:hypothetical protein